MTFLEPSFQIIFLIPKLPPMWPPLLLNFPIALILSFIQLLLLHSLVSLQCFLFSVLHSQLWFCLDQRIFWVTNVYKDVLDFLFFGHKNISDFLEFHLKLFFFYSFFFKILGPSFHLGALDNGLISLMEGPALHELIKDMHIVCYVWSSDWSCHHTNQY